MAKQHELLQFFTYKHLPENLRHVSEPYCLMAWDIANLPDEYFEFSATDLLQARAGALQKQPTQNCETTWAIAKLSQAQAQVSNCGIISREAHLNRVLRLILEAKDCAVRAVLYKAPEEV
jgi:hypothetical protein